MGLAAFNRMRKVYEEAKKVEEAIKPEVKQEEVVVAETVNVSEEKPEVKPEEVAEPTPRRNRRRNQE